MTLLNLNNLLKILFPDMVILGVRASIYEFGRFTVQSITPDMDCFGAVSVFMHSFTGEMLEL